MLNRKELESQGFSFEKIGNVEYLDLSKPKEKKIIAPCPFLKAEQAMRNHFLESSQERGKALSIILPLVDQEDMTELLAELYDLRASDRERKVRDAIAQREFEEDLPIINEALGTILTDLKKEQKEKCRPTKNQPKKPQPKKKVAVKKK